VEPLQHVALFTRGRRALEVLRGSVTAGSVYLTVTVLSHHQGILTGTPLLMVEIGADVQHAVAVAIFEIDDVRLVASMYLSYSACAP